MYLTEGSNYKSIYRYIIGLIGIWMTERRTLWVVNTSCIFFESHFYVYSIRLFKLVLSCVGWCGPTRATRCGAAAAAPRTRRAADTRDTRDTRRSPGPRPGTTGHNRPLRTIFFRYWKNSSIIGKNTMHFLNLIVKCQYFTIPMNFQCICDLKFIDLAKLLKYFLLIFNE